jgi:leucyl aminopeptidase
MRFELENKNINQIKADAEIIFIVNKNFNHKWVKDKKELEIVGFKGEDSECVLFAEKKRIYVALKSLEHDEIRKAIALAIKKITKTKIRNVKIGLYIENCPVANIKALVEGALLGAYSFEKYKSKKNENQIEKIIIAAEEYSDKKFSIQKAKESIAQAEIVAKAVNFTRDLINTPPNEITPKKLAKISKEIAEEKKLECIIMDEKDLKKEGMNAFLSVAKASDNPPRLIHLIYKPKKGTGKVAIVGKGLTYDSGGLSLKPSDYMRTMKADKSGACAVLGILIAASELNLPVEIHGILGAAENMIGGNAYKPDDVLIAKNKKSIEVKNTDAEGRLVLADSLCYIQEKGEFDYIIDIATLTGACVVALGEYTIGVMGFNKKLKEKFLKASKYSGELSSVLPFNDYLAKLLKSEIADISNISSSRYGGAITAALFLSEFIEERNKEKWIHLDIAGPAFIEKEWGYNPSGASGAGVRMVVKWLMQEYVFKKEK